MYTSSILGSGINDKLPWVSVFLSTLCVLGCSSFIFRKSTHILCLGASPGADFFGTTTIGLAQGLMLFLMTPAHVLVFQFPVEPSYNALEVVCMVFGILGDYHLYPHAL